MRRPEDCLAFFQIRGFLLLGLSSAGLGGRGGLRTILGRVADSTAEHAEIVVETALPFRVRELSILPKLIGEGGRMSGRGRRGFVVRFLLIFLVLAGVLIVRSGALLVVGFVVVGLVVGFVGLTIGLIFTGTGFLQLSFPVTGIDGMCHILHFVECVQFSLLAHDILDALRQARIVMVTEDGLVPTCTDSKTGKLDVVLVLKRRTDAEAECTEDGRDGRIVATEYQERNTEKRRKSGTYNIGVKDLASAYVLRPRLAECGGLSIYERNGVYGTMKGS